MKTKISKRDVKIFILGFFTFFIIEVIWSWDDTVNAFKEGWNATNSSTVETTK